MTTHCWPAENSVPASLGSSAQTASSAPMTASAGRTTCGLNVVRGEGRESGMSGIQLWAQRGATPSGAHIARRTLLRRASSVPRCQDCKKEHAEGKNLTDCKVLRRSRTPARFAWRADGTWKARWTPGLGRPDGACNAHRPGCGQRTEGAAVRVLKKTPGRPKFS
ncbi:hypothetical protein EMIT0111MI5_10561 [Burkholderia sp. IT-111MI5]